MLIDDFLFILFKLPLYDFLDKVDGHIHIIAHLLGANNVALDGNGHLNFLAFLLD